MALFDFDNTVKRLRNRYRLLIMNDDTYEEVVTFKLTRLSVYVAMCTVFIFLVGFTVALIVFTPIRYYIPGYGDVGQRSELMSIKLRTDSLVQEMKYKDLYLENLRNVLSGEKNITLDTTILNVPKVEISRY